MVLKQFRNFTTNKVFNQYKALIYKNPWIKAKVSSHSQPNKTSCVEAISFFKLEKLKKIWPTFHIMVSIHQYFDANVC